MFGIRDVALKKDSQKELLLDRHEQYLKQYANDDSGTDQIMAEYLKMSGMYWGLNALHIMKTLNKDSPEIPKTLEFIKACQKEDGGFAAAPRHDSHLLHTLSAIQMLIILEKCDPKYVDIEKCVSYVVSLQQKDGSFFGDKWGEVDTRFSFCALATLKLLNRLDSIDLNKAVEYVLLCNNQIDGGFGNKPGSESHSAYVYCCVGSLAIAGQLDKVDTETLGQWLSERQLPSGGFNGRPEKLPDLCYSWWCLASLHMIKKKDLINPEKLLTFILACQDEEGGFSDRPGNWVDPYHTMFGIASISLICHSHLNLEDMPLHNRVGETISVKRLKECLEHVDSVLCMPYDKVLNLYT